MPTLEECLTIPGARLTPRLLTTATTTTEAEVTGIAILSIRIAQESPWILAAALAAHRSRKGNTQTTEFCEAHGITSKQRRELLFVHDFYPPTSRTHHLSYAHYRDAALIAQPLPKARTVALAYLTQAAAHSWSVGQLRKAMRAAHATPEQPTTTQATGYSVVYDLRRFATKELPGVPRWSPERAKLVLADMGPAAEFIEQIRRIATSPTPPGCKKSLSL
jgi:hypothetical protein